ncbi:MAG: hypothetical protein PHY93_19635 [Bacteriovorax sp.]|nr:hypothetical protein [Bacteriovorax sp.]
MTKDTTEDEAEIFKDYDFFAWPKGSLLDEDFVDLNDAKEIFNLSQNKIISLIHKKKITPFAKYQDTVFPEEFNPVIPPAAFYPIHHPSLDTAYRSKKKIFTLNLLIGTHVDDKTGDRIETAITPKQKFTCPQIFVFKKQLFQIFPMTIKIESATHAEVVYQDPKGVIKCTFNDPRSVCIIEILYNRYKFNHNVGLKKADIDEEINKSKNKFTTSLRQGLEKYFPKEWDNFILIAEKDKNGLWHLKS